MFHLPGLHELPRWEGAARVCVDIETNDPELKKLGIGVRRGGYITGVSFAVDHDGGAAPNCPAFYLPVRHQGGPNYADPQQVFAYLRDQGRRFAGDLVLMNGQYDLDYLLEERVEFRPRFFRDVQVAGALLLEPRLKWEKDDDGNTFLAEERIPLNLNAMLDRAGLAGKDEAGLEAWAKERGLDPKRDMWQAPSGVVAPYAIQDVRAPLQLLKRQLRELEAQDLMPVFDLESRLLPVLLRMRRRGVRVDLGRVDLVEAEARRREQAAARVVQDRSGIPFDPEDISKAAVLEKHLAADGIKCPRTPTGLPSVKAGWLASLKTPTAQAIQECRKWNKVRTTFCASIRKHEVRGRIHCTFNQLRQESDDGDQKGVGFGRLSSDSPNLQQQPARDPEIGPLWRSIYVPDDGGQWACLDFSSQEPRWITHYAEVLAHDPHSGWDSTKRQAAIRAADDCRTNPNWDNHSMMAGFIYGDKYSHAAYVAGDKKAKGLRGEAKIIFLGKCYGMGGGKLCRSLGLPTIMVVRDTNAEGWVIHPVDSEEGQRLKKAGARPFEMAGEQGQAILRAFDDGVPYIRGLMKSTQRTAETRGWLRTALGRRCRFPENPVKGKDQPRYAWGHKALNRLIQGTSADQTKLAMVLADEAGIPLQLQVHDELDLTVPDRAMAERLVDIMVNALPCRVPTRVDIEMGPSWGEIHA
jgi:DNA polymerase I-like protein with 3'-5' exonuclease and polymerase domains